MMLSDKISKIAAVTTVKIVTSGYSDRFMSHNTKYTVFFSLNKKPLEVMFDFPEKMHDFIFELSGGTTETEYEKLVVECTDMMRQIHEITERETYISGPVNPGLYKTVRLSADDYKSIESYLHLYTGRADSYTENHINDCKNQLEQHPIEADLLEMVKNQIVECDEKNRKRDEFFSGKN